MTRQPYESPLHIGSMTARRRQRALALLALAAVIAAVVWLIVSNGGGPAHHHSLHASSVATLVGSARIAAAPSPGGAAVGVPWRVMGTGRSAGDGRPTGSESRGVAHLRLS
jgi:hypothetical protein